MRKIFVKYHEKWAREKIDFFLLNINLPGNSFILDLGGNNGAYMERFKTHCKENYRIIIADIDKGALEEAGQRGYDTRHMDGGEKFPFSDSEFECIFSNSAIEHVTVPKEEIWNFGNNFKERSMGIQKNFADEIRRCSKSYYVQTPHRHFPIEAHTWFPFVGFLPRVMQIRLIRLLNRFWFKKTTPDWNLLDEKQMKNLFPDANIFVIKKMGFKKEIIAIKPFKDN